MKKSFILFFLFSIVLSVSAQKVNYELKIHKVVFNQDSSAFPIVQEYGGDFKKSSDLISIWQYDGNEIAVHFEVIEEGYGKDKYLVFKSKYYHLKGKKRTLVATTSRHRFEKKYFNEGRFEYRDPNTDQYLAVIFELNLEAN